MVSESDILFKLKDSLGSPQHREERVLPFKVEDESLVVFETVKANKVGLIDDEDSGGIIIARERRHSLMPSNVSSDSSLEDLSEFPKKLVDILSQAFKNTNKTGSYIDQLTEEMMHPDFLDSCAPVDKIALLDTLIKHKQGSEKFISTIYKESSRHQIIKAYLGLNPVDEEQKQEEVIASKEDLKKSKVARGEIIKLLQDRNDEEEFTIDF